MNKYECFNHHPYEPDWVNCPVCKATIYEVPVQETMAETPQLKDTVRDSTNQTQTPLCTADLTETALVTLRQKNELLLKWLSQIKVTNCDERMNCADMLINARAALREAKEKLAEFLKPSHDEARRIRDIFNPFVEQVDTGIKSITTAMSQWDFEQEQIRQETLRKQREIDDLNTRIAAENARIHTENLVKIEAAKNTDQATGEIESKPIADLTPLMQPIVQVIQEIAPQKTTQSNVGSDTKITGFDIVIDNPDEVDRIYCDPSLVKLRAGFKIFDQIKGAHKIPKIIYQTRSRK